MARDQQGLALAGAPESAKAFDRAMADYYGLTGDPVGLGVGDRRQASLAEGAAHLGIGKQMQCSDRRAGFVSRGSSAFLRGFSSAMSHKSLKKYRAWFVGRSFSSDIDRRLCWGLQPLKPQGLKALFSVTGIVGPEGPTHKS